MEQWIESESLYEGYIISLKTGQVRLDDGTEAFREVVVHPGGVGVVPWLGDRVVLAKQYRVAIGEELLEIPAGKLEGGEEPEQRGRIELEEEVGYQAGSMLPAGFIYPSVGFLTERIHLFIATDLTKTEQRLEGDERIEIVEMGIEEVRGRLRENAFHDAKTVAGLHALLNHIA